MPIGFLERRRQTKQIERDIQARQGKARIRRHLAKQQGMSKKLWELGKRALQTGAKPQFRQIMLQYMWTLSDVKRWERTLITFEAIEARRDQAQATGDFMKSMQAMSKSIMASASPQAMAATQRDMEMGIARAQDLEERLSMLLDMSDETVFSPEDVSDDEMGGKLAEIEKAMTSEAEHDESSQLDERIEEGLRHIEQAMKKELK